MISSPTGPRAELCVARPGPLLSAATTEPGSAPPAMNTPNTAPMPPYGLGIRVPTPGAFAAYHPGLTHAALEFQRAQVYDYHARLQLGLRAYHSGAGLGSYPGPDPLAHPFFHARFDPRARLVQEEPKPQQSYIGLIGMAILSSKDKKLVLSDIYQWILDNYSYFRNRAPGWRNSIRHNLSLNDCFIKTGRSANGKGHYWAIHPANVEDFKKGDFRRRKAQRRVRKHMGLAVPDDEDSPSPPPPPSAEMEAWRAKMEAEDRAAAAAIEGKSPIPGSQISPSAESNRIAGKRRLFDMDSLLAPDDDACAKRLKETNSCTDVSLEVSDHEKCEPLSLANDDEDDEVVDVDTPDDGEPIPILVEPRAQGPEVLSAEDGSLHEHSPGPHDVSPRNSPMLGGCSSPPTSQTSPSSTPSGRGGSPAERGRMSWVSPGPLPLPVRGVWPEHISAFQKTSPGSLNGPLPGWGGMQPPNFPLLAAPFPVNPGSSPVELLAAQHRWQEAFSRIVARSYDKTDSVKATE